MVILKEDVQLPLALNVFAQHTGALESVSVRLCVKAMPSHAEI